MNSVLDEQQTESKATQPEPWPPQYLECQPGEIPSWIRNIKHWVVWHYERKDKGKHGKIPINPHTHERAGGSGEERLKATADFNTACHVFKTHEKTGGGKKLWSKKDKATDLAGLLALPTNADGVLAIDLDGCTDPNGIPNDEARKILDEFAGAYIERSPSGTGLRILIKTPDKIPGIKAKSANPPKGFGGVEFYTRDQLFSVTGQIWGHQDDPQRPVSRDKQLFKLMSLAGVKADETDQEKAQRQQKQKEAKAKRQQTQPPVGEGEAQLLRSALEKLPGADLHDSWIETGQALHNWGEKNQNSQEAFDLWCKWSGQSDKFSQEECEKRWASFKEEGGGKGTAVTIGTIFHRAQQAGWVHPGQPKSLPDGFFATDLGNARRLIANAGDSIRYCHGLGWLVWDGSRWKRDPDTKRVRRKAQEVSARLRSLASKADSEEKTKILQHAEYSERSGAISSMIQEASAMPELGIESTDLDQHPELLNTPAGVVCLKTGDLRPSDPTLLMTKVTGTGYDPKAECPQFMEAVRTWMNGDEEMVKYLQILAGMGATGHSEEMLFFDYGTGANGKTTYRELISDALDDFAVAIPADVMAQERFSNSNAPEPQKVRLMGARTAICSEWDSRRQLDTATMKRLCNTGRITARTLNAEPVEWTPTHSLFIQSNHEPKVILETEGERRRVRIIPWLVTIEKDKRDSSLRSKLKAELPGILRWIVQGAMEYLALREAGKELPMPTAVNTATTSFVEKADPFHGFIEECCDVRDNLEDSSSGLYDSFISFCDEGGFPHIDRRGFKARLEKHGLQSRRTSSGIFWMGIARKGAGEARVF